MRAEDDGGIAAVQIFATGLNIRSMRSSDYIGRIAPTPTGLLHAGHAATFGVVHRRAREAGGRLILRIEDIDPARCRPEYVEACMEDLRWLGLTWDEGPVRQSERREIFLKAWRRLRDEFPRAQRAEGRGTPHPSSSPTSPDNNHVIGMIDRFRSV